MPVVEFTHSEKGWYSDKTQQTNKMVADAEAAVLQAKRNREGMLGLVLFEISTSHGLPPPKNGNLIFDEKGAAIGLIWGKEEREFLDGKLVISGAIVPPKPPQPRVPGINGATEASASTAQWMLARAERKLKKKRRLSAESQTSTAEEGQPPPS